MSKKVAKLPFIDKTKYDKGIQMDSENQLVTIAVKDETPLDGVALTDAIESGGYKVEQIYMLSPSGEREVWMP